MSQKKVVETVYGKNHKYEIVEYRSTMLSSPEYQIYRDGSYCKSGYRSLADAVQSAKTLG